MAEYDHPLIAFHDDSGGVCQIVAVCESDQTEPHPEGGTSPLVVRLRLVNSTSKPGRATYVQSNGAVASGAVLPGENVEFNIAPPRRPALFRLDCSLAWGDGA